ncbi:ABC-three component system protein [Phyllobacterium sp. CCNWLW109]|uniref:ABC-three component system protein n=1 Tax=Phyllobacterium sp. CCNWLW109 TaxID=3127479 RepID=UPI003077DE30
MGAPQEQNHTAGPQASGYILQLERALYHLSRAEHDVTVAVEHFDDVTQLKNGLPVIQEQDKNSVRINADLLGDRSSALWRTLQIWLHQYRNTGLFCERYLIVTNSSVNSGVAKLLKSSREVDSPSVQDIVVMLKSIGKQRSKAKIVATMNDVLSASDAILTELLSRIEVIDGFVLAEARDEMVNGFAIHPGLDQQQILDFLLGWLTRILKEAWDAGLPGMVSRQACIRQCREIETSLARQRFLPRAARDIGIAERDRSRALARPFAEHLRRIDADDDDLLQAVEHFIQFNVEKHRLSADGDVADREWQDRGDRLVARWRNIMRVEKRAHRDLMPAEIGQRVLSATTYFHCELLGGQSCSELYMTSGHYHRLADDDEVWWHPNFRVAGEP